MKIILPWPDRRLSPNARLHWRAKLVPKQKARIDASWATLAAEGFHDWEEPDGPIPVTITFYAPDNRPRDMDNQIASMKAAMDGICDSLGVSDHRFEPTYRRGKPEKPGRVEIQVGI